MKLARNPENLAEYWDKYTRQRAPFTELRFEGAPGDYAPWKAPVLSLIAARLKTEAEGEWDDLGSELAYKAAMGFDAFDCPIYWVDRALLDAASNSFPPEDIPLESLKWPFPTMVVLLPKGTIVSAYGDCSSFVLSKVGRPGQDAVMIYACCYENIRKSVLKSQDVQGNSIKSERPDRCDLELAQRSFVDMCWDVAMRLMLAITARPELIESSPAEPKGAKSKAKHRFRAPRWIGRGYQPKTSGPTENHPGVRLHWRKGHFRNQAFGKGLSQSKVIWLEPCLVGGRGGEA